MCTKGENDGQIKLAKNQDSSKVTVKNLIRLIYFNRTVSKILNFWVLLYYSNRVVMHCNKVSLQTLLDCFDNNLENNIKNNA